MTKFGHFARQRCYTGMGIARETETGFMFHQGNGLFERMPLQSVGIAGLDIVFVLYHPV